MAFSASFKWFIFVGTDWIAIIIPIAQTLRKFQIRIRRVKKHVMTKQNSLWGHLINSCRLHVPALFTPPRVLQLSQNTVSWTKPMMEAEWRMCYRSLGKLLLRVANFSNFSLFRNNSAALGFYRVFRCDTNIVY